MCVTLKMGLDQNSPETPGICIHGVGRDIVHSLVPPFIYNACAAQMNVYSSPKSVSNHNSLPWLPATDP